MGYCFSVSSQGSKKYDVFLNFRGEDVRFNFLGYLIEALNYASLNIFVDFELERGEDIKSALKDAIQDSKVALTIFSEGYASSSWALDELVKIMACRKNRTLNQKVIPVFYHVDPSDVRNQSGVFAQDFAKHKKDYRSRRVRNWRDAMKAAGRLSGRSVEKTSPEVDVTMQIVNDVLKFLRRKPLKKISPGELKDNPNIQQQQRNGSIWTIPLRQGIQVLDVHTVLMSIRVQVGGEPSKSHSGQRSETSSSHPSSPISYHYGVNSYGLPTNSVTQGGLPMSSSTFACGGGNNTNGYGLGGTTAPYSSVSMSMATTPTMSPPTQRSTLTTGNFKSGFGSGGGNNRNGVNAYGRRCTMVPTSSVSYYKITKFKLPPMRWDLFLVLRRSKTPVT